MVLNLGTLQCFQWKYVKLKHVNVRRKFLNFVFEFQEILQVKHTQVVQLMLFFFIKQNYQLYRFCAAFRVELELRDVNSGELFIPDGKARPVPYLSPKEIPCIPKPRQSNHIRGSGPIRALGLLGSCEPGSQRENSDFQNKKEVVWKTDG